MFTTEQLYACYLKHPRVQTDTRLIRKGSLFFALRGPNFNGNKFAQEALDKGAAYAIIDEPQYQTNEKMLLVTDVLMALQQLAAHHRNQFAIPFLAITGSNGKTTTKELTYTVLQTAYKVYATEGNLNNHIGIPLTLLRIKPDTEIALIEMGANHQKEIESYCKIVRPTHGLITNIGKAHLEGFGGIEGVKKGKGELFDSLRSSKGVAFSCADFPYFKDMTAGLEEVHWYGSKDTLPVYGSVIQKSPFLSVELNGRIPIRTQLAGAYNLYNILAAAAVGKYFKVSDENIGKAISSYQPDNARSQIIRQGSNTIILDAYNANPSSMREAIIDFAERPGTEKCLFLGAMLELGEDSVKEHQQLVQLLQKYQWKEVILVGGDFQKTVQHAYTYFPSVKEAAAWFHLQNYQNAIILIKGSHSIGMEKLLN